MTRIARHAPRGPGRRRTSAAAAGAIRLLLLGTVLSPLPAFAQPSWATMAPMPSGCPAQGFAAVWTGPPLNRVLVWGGLGASGYTNAGCSYDPVSDAWSAISIVGAPAPRASHTATWTGSEMIVWGGSDASGLLFKGGGGRYDPSTDTWRSMSRVHPPAARQGHTAVWTGSRLVVWGGWVESGLPGTGALYDPVSDTWTPMTAVGQPSTRTGHSGVFTGSRLIVWGGVGPFNSTLGDGGVYDPVADRWTPTGGTPPSARHGHSTAWTGSRMVVWGGRSGMPGTELDTGGIYDPATDSWIPTATAGAPSARIAAARAWTGSRLVVWGGSQDDAATGTTCFGDGALFDPGSNSWTPLEGPGPPSPRPVALAIWTGTELLVVGGCDCAFTPLADGRRWSAVSQRELRFHPLAPCRVLDTRRTPDGPLGGPALLAGERRTFDVVASGCGVPAEATSIAGNLTATAPTAEGTLGIGAGNAVAGPPGALPFRPGATRAVFVFPRLATDATGTVAIENLSPGTTHAVLDVSGYFR